MKSKVLTVIAILIAGAFTLGIFKFFIKQLPQAAKTPAEVAVDAPSLEKMPVKAGAPLPPGTIDKVEEPVGTKVAVWYDTRMTGSGGGHFESEVQLVTESTARDEGRRYNVLPAGVKDGVDLLTMVEGKLYLADNGAGINVFSPSKRVFEPLAAAEDAVWADDGYRVVQLSPRGNDILYVVCTLDQPGFCQVRLYGGDTQSVREAGPKTEMSLYEGIRIQSWDPATNKALLISNGGDANYRVGREFALTIGGEQKTVHDFTIDLACSSDSGFEEPEPGQCGPKETADITAWRAWLAVQPKTVPETWPQTCGAMTIKSYKDEQQRTYAGCITLE